jgi:hypothetical protein
MEKENQVLLSFLYFYGEFGKFLYSIAKENAYIGSPMIIFMANVYNSYLEERRPLKKHELHNDRYTPTASFYRLVKQAVELGFITKIDETQYVIRHGLPPHLKLLKTEIMI